MNLDKAVHYHSSWKNKFRKSIQNREKIDQDTTLRIETCEFGIWMESEGKEKYSNLDSYIDCCKSHKEFHEIADKVIQLINARNYTEAEKSLNIDSEFSRASQDLLKKIIDFNRETMQ